MSQIELPNYTFKAEMKVKLHIPKKKRFKSVSSNFYNYIISMFSMLFCRKMKIIGLGCHMGEEERKGRRIELYTYGENVRMLSLVLCFIQWYIV